MKKLSTKYKSTLFDVAGGTTLLLVFGFSIVLIIIVLVLIVVAIGLIIKAIKNNKKSDDQNK